MRTIKYIFLAISLIAFGYLESQSESKTFCKDKQNCLNNPECLCYCSGICEPREKKPEDKPVYVENDPRGHYCYCKQWDIDVYEEHGCGLENWD